MTGQTESRVLALVAAIAGSRPIDPVAGWRTLGLDSLDLLSLVISVEDEFRVVIPDAQAVLLRNVSDVVTLIAHDGDVAAD